MEAPKDSSAAALSSPATSSEAPRLSSSEALRAVVARLVEPEGPIRLARGQILARVNDVPIVASDLIPWRAEDRKERGMTHEMFAFLLKRAIDRELVSQAAGAQSISLSAAQVGQLERLRAAEQERDPAQVEFDVRDAASELLLADLVAKSGGPNPYAGPADVEAYYRRHADELGALPAATEARAAAWQQIEARIRQILATERQAAYRDRIQDILGELEAHARISDS
ncbi:MAG: hypothetical protein E6J78_17115 [Deltaproteobacteria bacterium]|nr:MAG: hypothetical protein E6J78_17115 [Deltaproteobacteria bacterium]